MDPLLILAASIFTILLASVMVNFYYIRGHYLHHSEHITTTTQTINNWLADTETQTENQKLLVDIHEKSTQNVPTTETIGTDTCNLVQVETCVQMDKVYYVMLPEQLDQILEQSKINRTDLTHCMEWVGECEQATLSAIRAVDQQSQLIQNTQADIHQEL